jgi:alpha-L-arabinofuranosidase
MYAHNSGSLGVPVQVRGGAGVQLPGSERSSALDVVGSLSADRRFLYLNVVNRLADEAVTARLNVGGFAAADEVRVVTLSADSPEAANTAQNPERVRTQERTVSLAEALGYSFPAHSATALVFTAR